MAQFDLKKAIIKLCDGRLATLTTTAGAGVNAQLTLTDKSRHRGTREPVSIALVNPGTNNAVLGVVVTGVNIVVNLATDGAAAITSTAALVKAAIEANADANALVTVTLPGTGASVVSAQAATDLANGARTLTIYVHEGTISYTEKAPRKYTRNRGRLDKVMDADEEPMDVRFDLIWDFITAETGSGTPTPRDVLKRTGEAAAWESTSDDQCEPFCVDIEIKYDPDCSGVDNEFTMLEEFRYEQVDFNAKEATLSVTGKCNVTEAQVYRE
jgi:hypothetical protein